MKNLTNVEMAAINNGVNLALVEEIENKAFAKNSNENYNVIVRDLQEWTSANLNEIHVAGTTVIANKITFGKKGRVEVELQALSRGPLAKCAGLEEGKVSKEGITMPENNKYTRELLVVGVAEDAKIGKLIKRNGLAVKYKLVGLGSKKKASRVIEQVYTMSTNENGILTLTPCLKVKGVKVDPICGDNAKMILDTCTHYRIQSSSQAQERNVEMILSSWDTEYAFAVKVALSGRYLLELFYENNYSLEFGLAAKKWFKRDALIGSTMIPFGEISEDYGTGMIVTADEFKGNEIDVVEIEEANRIGYMQDNSSQEFNKANNGTKDGIAFARKSYVAKASAKEYGIHISANKLNVDPQMRITGVGVKSLVELEEDLVFDRRLKNIMADKVEVSLEEAVRRLDAGKLYLADNEYVVLGDRNNICFIADDNASKYLAVQGKYRVMLLDVPRINKKNVNLSWQALNKVFSFASDETIDYLVNKFEFDMAESVRKTLFEECEPTLVGNASAVALSLNKKAKTVYDNVLSLLNDFTQEATSKIEGGKVSVPGIFVRAAFESSDMLADVNILEAGGHFAEVFCPTLNDGEYVVGLKFPCPTEEEFQVYKNVGLKTIVKRVEALKAAGTITEEDAEILIAKFKGYGESTLVIVQEDSLKHKQAGMDTDYDGLQLIRDEKIVADAVADYKAKGYCGETIVIAKMKK